MPDGPMRRPRSIHTIIEPFRIKSVEPIRLTTPEERDALIRQALDPDYQKYRIASTAYLGNHIAAGGVPIVQPPGGHAVYIDAAAFCPHLEPFDYPGISLCVELYREAGIRAVEIGSVMFGADDPDTGERRPARSELSASRFLAASTRRATSTTRSKRSSTCSTGGATWAATGSRTNPSSSGTSPAGSPRSGEADGGGGPVGAVGAIGYSRPARKSSTAVSTASRLRLGYPA